MATCGAFSATASDGLPVLPRLDARGKLEAREPVAAGEPALVALFAVWCEPCASEVPMLNRLGHWTQGRGVRVVGIASDDTPPPQIAAWRRKHGGDYPIYLSTGPDRRRHPALAAERLPTLLLLSKTGRVLRRWVGRVPEGALRAALSPLLTPASPTH